MFNKIQRPAHYLDDQRLITIHRYTQGWEPTSARSIIHSACITTKQDMAQRFSDMDFHLYEPTGPASPTDTTVRETYAQAKPNSLERCRRVCRYLFQTIENITRTKSKRNCISCLNIPLIVYLVCVCVCVCARARVRAHL